MNNKQYITAIAYIILLRLLDLGLTFIHTPRLQYEWNPIVSVFGYSWMGMLITQILVVSLIVAVMSFYFFKKPLTNLPNDLSFIDYVYYYFHNQKRSTGKKWLKYNRITINRILAYNGFILLTMAISISYLAIINNLMIIYAVKSYSSFIVQYGSFFYISVLVFMAISSFVLFFVLEYKSYRKKLVKVYFTN
ncbi:MAG: hypothetical protein MUP82_04880 [Candidatus Marinimicrobia bacterium]|nr:hypothetical protein [Candidatus Neomarinimicrobiota bacterium]